MQQPFSKKQKKACRSLQQKVLLFDNCEYRDPNGKRAGRKFKQSGVLTAKPRKRLTYVAALTHSASVKKQIRRRG